MKKNDVDFSYTAYNIINEKGIKISAGTIYNVLNGKKKISDVIQQTRVNNLNLITSKLRLLGRLIDFFTSINSLRFLRETFA